MSLWEASKYNCNGNTEKDTIHFEVLAWMEPSLPLRKKGKPLKLGPPTAPAASCTRECPYFIIFLYSCIYLKNTSSFTKKSHVSSGKIPQVVSQVGVNCFEKFKGDPSKPYCSACCKGLLAKAASKSPGSRSKQEKIHDPQLWKLQNTFKKTVKLFKSEEKFRFGKGITFLDTETLQIANDLDATWKSPLQISFLFPFPAAVLLLHHTHP